MKNHPGLPAGWMASQIGAVSRVVAGYGFPLELQGKASGDFPFFKVGDISRAWVAGQDELSRTDHYLTEDEAATIRARPFPAGTTVFAKIGAAIALNRRALLCRPSLIDNNVMGLIPHDGCLDRRFLFHFTKTLRLDGLSQATTVPSLRKGDVESIDIPLPPLNEQRRIVAKIEDLTARSQAAKQALDAIPPLLERFRQSVLAAAFRGDLTKQWRQQNPNVEPATELLKRIRQERRQRWEQDYLAQQKAKGKTPKDDKWKEKYQEPEPVDTEGLPELPERWCWASLDLLSEFVTDGDHNPPKRKPDGVPHLTARNVRHWAINYEKCTYISESDFEKVRKRYEPRPGDVIITCVGTVGETAIIPRGAVFSADRNLAAVRPLEGMFSEVLQFFLNSPTLQYMMQNSSGSTAQPHLYLTQLRTFPIPLPPSEEQSALRDLAETRLQEISNVATVIIKSTFLRNRLDQSILAKAFRGELVPQDPGDEPASALLERIRAEREATPPAENGRQRKGRAR